MNKQYKKNQKVTWHNGVESGRVKSTDDKQIVIKWEGAGVIAYPVIVAENWVK